MDCVTELIFVLSTLFGVIAMIGAVYLWVSLALSDRPVTLRVWVVSVLLAVMIADSYDTVIRLAAR